MGSLSEQQHESCGDEIAVVTGGASAIGEAVCHRIAETGQRVAVVDLHGATAHEVAAELPGFGHLAVGLDVTDTVRVHDKFSYIERLYGPIGTLVNAAEWDPYAPFSESKVREYWQQVVGINYRGALNTVHAVLPGMIARGDGRIVTVTSDEARPSLPDTGQPGQRGAIVSFSRNVASEVAKHGVSVNVVCLGPTDTARLHSTPDVGTGEQYIDALTNAIPMRRLASPQDVAPAIAFLASADAGFITGQALSVNGGLTMV